MHLPACELPFHRESFYVTGTLLSSLSTFLHRFYAYILWTSCSLGSNKRPRPQRVAQVQFLFYYLWLYLDLRCIYIFLTPRTASPKRCWRKMRPVTASSSISSSSFSGTMHVCGKEKIAAEGEEYPPEGNIYTSWLFDFWRSHIC